MKRRGKYGANAERELKQILEQENYFVTRSGGSLGMFDLIALMVNPDGHSLYIQVKAGSAKYIRSCQRKWDKRTPLMMPTCHHELLICKERNKGWLNNPDLPFLLTSKRKKS